MEEGDGLDADCRNRWGPWFKLENLEHLVLLVRKEEAGEATEEMGKVKGAAVQGVDSIHR